MLVQSTDQKKPSGILSFFLQFAVVAVIFFAIGFAVGQKKVAIEKKGLVPNITVTNELAPKNQTVDFSLFWKVFDTLPQRYLDKSAIDGQKMMYGAIEGMVRSLGDPYTAFLDPKQNEAVKDELSGSYSGIGIQIGFDRDKRLAVIAPLTGTPAAGAGVRPKDLIIKISNKDTFGMTLPEAVDLIRGPAGTSVDLILQHSGEDKTYEKNIERQNIDVKSVTVDYKGEVAVIKVSNFGEKTDSEWDKAVGEISQKGTKKVIVDLRNNPGGLLTSAIHLASDFVSGTIVKQQFSDGSQTALYSDHNARFANVGLVVLINGGSASASEIFAGAIKDNGRGKIVGEKSFGKGTVQDVIDFPGGSGLHVTIAKWLTPNGANIHGVGISPDINVVGNTDVNSSDDPQLTKALAL